MVCVNFCFFGVCWFFCLCYVGIVCKSYVDFRWWVLGCILWMVIDLLVGVVVCCVWEWMRCLSCFGWKWIDFVKLFVRCYIIGYKIWLWVVWSCFVVVLKWVCLIIGLDLCFGCYLYDVWWFDFVFGYDLFDVFSDVVFVFVFCFGLFVC